MCVFCFKQKTAYEMRISDWSSDVCSSDLTAGGAERALDEHGEGCRQEQRHQRQVGTQPDPLTARRWAPSRWRPQRHRYSRPPSLQAVLHHEQRSEERRGGKECVRMWRSRWSPYNKKKQIDTKRKCL